MVLAVLDLEEETAGTRHCAMTGLMVRIKAIGIIVPLNMELVIVGGRKNKL